MSRFAASFALPVLLISLLASSCGRSTTLGPVEAVEVMVLDGIDRGRAVCIVDALDDDLDLAKVSGLEVDLDDERQLLAATSAQCAPALALNGTIHFGESPMNEAAIAAEILGASATIEDRIGALVDEGLDFSVGQCLDRQLALLPAPHEALDDIVQRSELIVTCRIDLGLDPAG
ncbi:MAG: hypothetical protein P8J50_03235 [Acidimicrobiales bacterium]|nr:hypothetical protein [Acidimicrobiales bacterium]